MNYKLKYNCIDNLSSITKDPDICKYDSYKKIYILYVQKHLLLPDSKMSLNANPSKQHLG